MALVLTEQEINMLHSAMSDLLKKSEALCSLLVNQDGTCLARRGSTTDLDCDALAALTAGSFASTRAMAKLVGESEFSVLFHQGDKEHIHNILVDDDTILTVIFDERTTIGMVRLYSKECAAAIRGLLLDARSRKGKPGAEGAQDAFLDAGKEAGEQIDNIFGD
jgi:predicted regulator of Ras-like GTPase activity (Roadblock/LC7/MglB family)